MEVHPALRLGPVLLVALFFGCGEARVPYPVTGGWGLSGAAPASSVYPAHYPRLTKAEVQSRQARLQSENPTWTLTLGHSGFLAQATLVVPERDTLDSGEIEIAQRFIDAHFALYGLPRATPLKRWHDGLYYISPIDDPRYGVAVLHRGPRMNIAGHLWPGFTMRSTARKDPRELLGPWLGRRIRSQDAPIHNCDPVRSEGDCSPPPEPTVVTIGTDNVAYVVHARLTDTDIEVRELLVLPLFQGMVLLEPDKGPLPSALDARTGEKLDLAAWGPGMTDESGASALWGWFKDPSHLDFSVRTDVPWFPEPSNPSQPYGPSPSL